jgi:uncharacterized membrane protein YkvA (DUF1232 family)
MGARVSPGERWRTEARRLKREVYALYLACRDPRVPWYAKALAAGIVAYALSPIDLIPDFIPILGYLDDLILLPLGVATSSTETIAPKLSPCWPTGDATEAGDAELAGHVKGRDRAAES